MAKSFIPQFIKILRRLKVYMAKHEETMKLFLSADQITCLNNLVTEVDTCAAAFGVYVEGP